MSVDLTADRELADTTAAAIRGHRDELATTVVETLYRNPFWEARFGPRGRAHSLEDAGYHFDQRVAVLALGIPDELRFYYRWLQELLVPRGLSSRHLLETIDAMHGALMGVLTASQTALAARYLQVGKTALVQDHPFAQRIAEGEDQIIATSDGAVRAWAKEQDKTLGSRGGGQDLRYRLSYLVDAIAAGRPDLFSGNAGWVAGFRIQAGAGVEALRVSVEALGAAASKAAPDYREQIRECVARALREIDRTHPAAADHRGRRAPPRPHSEILRHSDRAGRRK